MQAILVVPTWSTGYYSMHYDTWVAARYRLLPVKSCNTCVLLKLTTRLHYKVTIVQIFYSTDLVNYEFALLFVRPHCCR